MLRFLAQRLFGAIGVLLVVSVLVFLLLRVTPGDPAAVIAGDNASPEQIQGIRESLGLERSLATQFGIWFGNLLRGDLGESFFFKKPVAALIAQRVEPTVALAFGTILIAVLVAVPLGVLAAWRQGGWLDRALIGVSMLGFSVPVFVLGYFLSWLFSLELGWLPVQGYRRLGQGFIPFVRYLILPSMTLSVVYIALIARVTRAAVAEALTEDFVRTARTKGLSEGRVLVRHALANAAVPIVTTIGLGLAILLGGVVVTESVFSIPGLGRLTVEAVLAGDFPTVQGVILLFSVSYVTVNVIIDLSYPLFDPRIRYLGADSVLESKTEDTAAAPAEPGAWQRLARNWSVRIGGVVLTVITLAAVCAPWLGVVDPMLIDAGNRDLLPGSFGMVPRSAGERVQHIFWMGADSYGRDIYSRVLYGGRVSLAVGSTVALLSVAFGVAIGMVTGYARWVDSVLMRLMDGVMAIPGILLALTLVAIWRASLWTVVLAITLTEIPRVVRLVRSVVLSIREEPYIEAAISVGTPTFKVLYRHVLPNTIAPLIVQGTYVFAFAMLVEASLSFLGVGLPADLPTWGNIMAEGRLQFIQYPHSVLFPGLVLGATVLAVNMLGDGLRDTLDPRFRSRGQPL